jgi:glycerol-3-phosphate dehydrogenase
MDADRFSNRMGPQQRAAAVARMSDETFDVAIVGGGVTGCGAALDAATRGLSVALIEQRDWASGTSSRSSKLIHGGLRYLEQGEIGLVREARHEQALMLSRLCPHLVRPVSFLLPLESRWARRPWQRAYYGAGIFLYEWLSGRRVLPRHRHHSRRSALERFPSLRREGLAGAIEYYDALVDDARHTLTLARTAASHGAAVASSVRAEGFVDSGSSITGVRAHCLETNERFAIRARRIVNATGVWTDRVQDMAGRGLIHVRASKGVHLVVPRDRIRGDAGLILRTASSVLFVIPWKEHWIIGTTDSDWNLDLAHPAASARDVAYLLDTVNEVLDEPLTKSDIEGVYAGLRPLLTGEDDATSQLSREHAVSESVSGLITVAGGKYTTYRVMARDTIDLVARELPQKVPESCTDETPLLGAEGYEAAWNRREELARESGLAPSQVEHLLSRYGSLTSELLARIAERPELGRPLEGASRYLAVEVAYAASHEAALHLEDVLTRRTRISVETFDRGVAAAPAAARLMGQELGWDDERIEREVRSYELRVAAERESQEQLDDLSADATRLGAPDVRMGSRAHAHGRPDADEPVGADVLQLRPRIRR